MQQDSMITINDIDEETKDTMEMMEGLNEYDAAAGEKENPKPTDEEIKQATIQGTIPTIIADSGASSTCVKPAEEQMLTSECGAYKWTGTPFTTTGEKSNKVFSMALGNIAPAQDIVNLPLPLRTEATKAHTVSG